jgi:hypothetical protein
MDNIVMAKMMHDIGKPLPGSCYFSADSFHYQADSLFYPSMEQLFEFKLDLEEIENEDQRRFVIPLPDLSLLCRETQQRLVKPLKSISCNMFELEFRTKLGEGELQVTVSGSYGYSYKALFEFIQFKKRLDEKLKEVVANGPHAG